MRVVLGWTLLLAFVGAVLLIATAGQVRGAWPWLAQPGWGRYAAFGLIAALAAGTALRALAEAWAREMDAFRAPWIALACAVLAVLVSAGTWSAFALWMLNLQDVRVSDPSAVAVWVAALWLCGSVLWLAFFVWDHRRWQVLRRVQAQDPCTPGPRSFEGTIVAVPGEPMLRDPLNNTACVSWTVDGVNAEDEPEETSPPTGYLAGRWVPAIAKERAGFDARASAFYVVVGDAFIRVRPEGIDMVGRPGAGTDIETVILGDRGLAERARALGVRSIRTRLLTVGDPVIATGVITTDADGGLTLQAEPDGGRGPALASRASVRVRVDRRA